MFCVLTLLVWSGLFVDALGQVARRRSVRIPLEFAVFAASLLFASVVLIIRWARHRR